MSRWNLLFLAAAGMIYGSTAGAFDYSEAADGSLSIIPAIPTELTLAEGENTISGTAGTTTLDRGLPDLFTFNVAPGQVLTGITLDAYENTVENGMAFMAIQSGNTWTADIGGDVVASALLGWDLIDDSDLGLDLLPTLAIADQNSSGNIGFSLPLGPGDYTFLLQDTTSFFDYQLTFSAAPVPIPPLLPLIIGAFTGMALPRRRRNG